MWNSTCSCVYYTFTVQVRKGLKYYVTSSLSVHQNQVQEFLRLFRLYEIQNNIMHMAIN